MSHSMTHHYFSSPERIAQLDAEAKSWVGTPFAPHAMVKTAGTDCVHLAAGIYLACGVIKSFVPGRYALEQGERIAAWFSDRHNFARLREEKYIPGDFLILNFGKFKHAALVITAGIIHVLPQREVIVSDWRESFYRNRITDSFRPLEVRA